MAEKSVLVDVGAGNLSFTISTYSKKLKGLAKAICDAIVEECFREFEQEGTHIGSWEKLSDMTIAMKYKTKILHKTGGLKESIHTEEITDDYAFVEASDPKAAIHEFGIIIKVTDEIRNWFLAQSIKSQGKIKPLSPMTKQMVIPARPFLGPAFDKVMKDKLPEIMAWHFPDAPPLKTRVSGVLG